MSALPFAAIVRQRAGDRCEYCRMHQSLQGATFHVEHIQPEVHGGLTELENLAWACPGCNLRKSDRMRLRDPGTEQLVRFFDPRHDDWSEHFSWEVFRVSGLTSIGRAMVQGLDLNHLRRQRIRQAEQTFGLFEGDPESFEAAGP